MLCVLLSLHSSSGDATNWVACMGSVNVEHVILSDLCICHVSNIQS